MSHTPGPWTIAPLEHCEGEEIRGPNHESICDLPFWTGHRDELRANAQLIAAAPDLLAACKMAFKKIDDPRLWGPLSDAIRKAEG